MSIVSTRAALTVPTLERGGDDRCREAGQCADFDHTLRRKNARERSEKQVILRAKRAGILALSATDRGKEFAFAVWRDRVATAKHFRETRVADKVGID